MRSFVLGLWMPPVDCSLDMEPLRFVAGSHKYGHLENPSISEESAFFADFIEREGLKVAGYQPATVSEEAGRGRRDLNPWSPA